MVVAKPSVEIENISYLALAEALAAEKWFSDRGTSTFWLHVYASVGQPYNDICKFYKAGISKMALPPDIVLRYGRFGGTFNRLVTFFSVNEDGQIELCVEQAREELSSSPSVFISTPHKVDGAGANEGVTKKRLTHFSTIVRSHIGPHCLFKLVHDAEHRADTGEVEQIFSTPFTAPTTCADPYLHQDMFCGAGDLYKAFNALGAAEKQVVSTAIEYFAQGIEGRDLYSYWTCLELLADGKAPKIRSMLQKCYGLKRPHDVDTEAGFKTITSWRHDLIHRGIKVTLNDWVERYLQFMIIDVMRLRLGMAPNKLAERFAGMRGVNLAMIGMADNRTSEQKHLSLLLEEEKGIMVLSHPRGAAG